MNECTIMTIMPVWFETSYHKNQEKKILYCKCWVTFIFFALVHFWI